MTNGNSTSADPLNAISYHVYMISSVALLTYYLVAVLELTIPQHCPSFWQIKTGSFDGQAKVLVAKKNKI
jgi:hypothetical protein